MMQDNCILMGDAVYQKLTADQKKIIDQASRDTEAELRPKVVADDAEIMAKVRAKKITVTEVDKGAFAATVKKLVNEFPAGKKWVERFAQIS